VVRQIAVEIGDAALPDEGGHLSQAKRAIMGNLHRLGDALLLLMDGALGNFAYATRVGPDLQLEHIDHVVVDASLMSWDVNEKFRGCVRWYFCQHFGLLHQEPICS
jgi:hypothetical protein